MDGYDDAVGPMLAASQARESPFIAPSVTPERADISPREVHFRAEANSYVRGGTYGGTVVYDGWDLILKQPADLLNFQYTRQVFLRFNLTSFTQASVGRALVRLTTRVTQFRTVGQVSVNWPYRLALREATSNNWTDALTWNTRPPVQGTNLAVAWLRESGQDLLFDVTDFVNARLAAGNRVCSFMITDIDTVDQTLSFHSRAQTDPPTMILLGPGEPAGSRPVPGESLRAAEFTESVSDVRVTSTDFATRLVDTVQDFSEGPPPELDEYGGLLSGLTLTPTGFYRHQRIGERWWLITPTGRRTLHMGVNAINHEGRDLEAFNLRYGTESAWANATVQMLRDDRGFNLSGAWEFQHEESGWQFNPAGNPVRAVTPTLPYAPLLDLCFHYANDNGLGSFGTGHFVYTHGVIPVFDPAFVTYVRNRCAELITPTVASDPYLIGWQTDNEMPAGHDFLERYLQLPQDGPWGYSYAAARSWFTARKGPSAGVADITEADKDAWVDVVYDRYGQVVTDAIRRQDTNHMILGPRGYSTTGEQPGWFAAIGRHFDAVLFNLYQSWTPPTERLRRWGTYAQKPVVATEWYASETGLGGQWAGWEVATQDDRAKFYANFALALLESPWCVGWHWFQYQDVGTKNAGIVNSTYDLYESLADAMRQVNHNAFALLDHFDTRRKALTASVIGNLRGPQGIQGPQGNQGPPGVWAGPAITVGPNPPSQPAVNDLWVDTSGA